MFVKRIFIVIWSVLLLMQPAATTVASNSDPDATEVPLSIEIRTLYADGAPLYAQQLEWWVTGNEQNKQILHCNLSECATWVTQLGFLRASSVHLVALKSTNDDPLCAVWYTGELNLADSSSESNHSPIRLERGPTACK